MSKLYLMRHGETYFNIWHKIQGWCDSPLTPKGIAQAKSAGKYFAKHHIHFDKAYCSTAERTSDTLESATNKKLPYQRLKGLKECNFGEFEGQDERLNLQPPYGDFFVQYGGESDVQVQQRLLKALSQIMQSANKNENILVVSHAGAIFNFLVAANIDVTPIVGQRFGNCSIVVIDYQNNKFRFEKVINPLFQK